jgi:hypothetical protein
MSSSPVELIRGLLTRAKASLNGGQAAKPPDSPDLSKPRPNPGEPNRVPPYKTSYARERIQLQNFSDVFDDLTKASDRETLCQDLTLSPKRLPGFHIRGKCPSCNHKTSAVCATSFLAHDDETVAADARGKMTQVTLVRCACNYNHVPTNAGDFGCGSEWLLRAHFDVEMADDPRFECVDDTEASNRWPLAAKAFDDVAQCLTSAQNAAKSWAPALAAVLAVFGIAALLTNRSTVQALSGFWQVVFIVAVGTAVLGDLFMLWSDLAQFGKPWKGKPPQRGRLEHEDLQPLFQASSSARRLRDAVVATAGAVVAALVAIAIVLFAPAPAPAATSKVTYHADSGITGTSPCSRVIATGPANVEFKPNVSGGTLVTVPLHNVTSIEAC